jgi:hypothetical protein
VQVDESICNETWLIKIADKKTCANLPTSFDFTVVLPSKYDGNNWRRMNRQVLPFDILPRMNAGDSYWLYTLSHTMPSVGSCFVAESHDRSTGYSLTHDIPTPEGLHPYRC